MSLLRRILLKFPVAANPPRRIARLLDSEAQRLTRRSRRLYAVVTRRHAQALDAARGEAEATRTSMIALQEELDWRCYRLYGLHEAPPEHPEPPPLQLGERAFEIVMARQMAAGMLDTTWFERHGSTPITDLPNHWPDDYRSVVEQRIALIETDGNIGMIERPEFKRRWSTESWEAMEQAALRTWLLDRMEAPTIWTTGDARLLSTNQLTDLLRRDADFLSVAALYAGRADVNLEALVAELVAEGIRAVPSLPFATRKPGCASGRNGKRPGTSSGAKTRSMPRSSRGVTRSAPRPSGARRSNGRRPIHAVSAKAPSPTRSACRPAPRRPWSSRSTGWSRRSSADASARKSATFPCRRNTSPRIFKGRISGELFDHAAVVLIVTVSGDEVRTALPGSLWSSWNVVLSLPLAAGARALVSSRSRIEPCWPPARGPLPTSAAR